MADSTSKVVSEVLQLFGWRAQDGGKEGEFAANFVALGVCFD